MPDKFRDIILPIPEKRLETLRKNIEKYKESVNKCNVSMIDSLSFDIGSEMDILKFIVKINDDQKKQLHNLEEEHKIYSNKVRQCQCIRKLER